MAVTYRLTGGGSAVIETLFAGTPEEMVTVYHRDGSDLVLTHDCAGGNQPRMRARTIEGNTLAFEFEGGTNVDPGKDDHMHSGRLEFVSADEIRAEWQGWSGGRPDPAHLARFHLTRKKGSLVGGLRGGASTAPAALRTPVCGAPSAPGRSRSGRGRPAFHGPSPGAIPAPPGRGGSGDPSWRRLPAAPRRTGR